MVNGSIAIESIAKVRRCRQKLPMTQFNNRSSLLAFLKSRKSASAKAMGAPGPTNSQLADMLQLSVRVPDHGKLAPWRFVVFEGEARGAVGKLFAARFAERHPDYPAENVAFQAGLFERAPVVVGVVSTAAVHGKIPVWEQQMSAAAVCFNLVLAAQAHGFDAQWQSDWVAYDEGAKAAMGIAAHEAVAGLIYIGTSTVPLEDRPRPDAASLTAWWKTPA
jgi:nitroreductase